MIENVALKKIKEAEDALIRLTTKEEVLMKTLKDKYNLNSIAEADIYLDASEKKLDDLESLIAQKRKELEEGYDWN